MPPIISTIKEKICQFGKGSLAFCKDVANYQTISQTVSKIGNDGQEICKGFYCRLKNDTFNPRRRALAKTWMPSAVVYGLTAVIGLIYFTDWSPLTKKLKRKMVVDGFHGRTIYVASSVALMYFTYCKLLLQYVPYINRKFYSKY